MNARPCPFCGAVPHVQTVSRKTTRLTATLIQCLHSDCEIRPQLGPMWTTEEAVIRVWNTRRKRSKQNP